MNLNVILLIIGIVFALLILIGASKLIFRCGRKILTIVVTPIFLIIKLFKTLVNRIKQ